VYGERKFCCISVVAPERKFRKHCTKALIANDKLDEFEAMAINFSAKLKKMAPTQLIFA
jgi:hypothetical protein